MKDLRTRNSQRRFHHSRPFIIFLCIVFIVFARSVIVSFHKKKRAHTEQERFETTYDELLRKKTKLEESIEKLETDRGLEEEYRTRFNVIEAGETLIKVVEEES